MSHLFGILKFGLSMTEKYQLQILILDLKDKYQLYLHPIELGQSRVYTRSGYRINTGKMNSASMTKRRSCVVVVLAPEEHQVSGSNPILHSFFWHKSFCQKNRVTPQAKAGLEPRSRRSKEYSHTIALLKYVQSVSIYLFTHPNRLQAQ